jgi:hypothetical protein
MNIRDFLMAIGSALVSLVLPKCNGLFEANVAGTAIFGQIYKGMRYATEHEKDLRDMGILDAKGNVDIPLAAFAVGHGLQWPIQAGPFVFKKEDWDYIIQTIQPNIQNVEVTEK